MLNRAKNYNIRTAEDCKIENGMLVIIGENDMSKETDTFRYPLHNIEHFNYIELGE
jgi:hypothetical protein